MIPIPKYRAIISYIALLWPNIAIYYIFMLPIRLNNFPFDLIISQHIPLLPKHYILPYLIKKNSNFCI